MLNKDRDGKASPFVMLLVILLGMTSMVLDVVVMPSSPSRLNLTEFLSGPI